jgi:hypothetical protein
MNFYYIIYFFRKETSNPDNKLAEILGLLKGSEVQVHDIKPPTVNLLLVSTKQDLNSVVLPIFGKLGDDIFVFVPRSTADKSHYVHPKWLKDELAVPDEIDIKNFTQHVADTLTSQGVLFH